MQRWTTPIEITLDATGRQTLHGPFAAAMMLTIVWPVREGKWREEAERVCLAASEGRALPDEARRAFLAAVHEAGVTLHGEGRDRPIMLAEPRIAGAPRVTGDDIAVRL